MKIKKLPNVLALHLKRFKYQEDVQKYIKLAYRVAFPFELRLFNTVDDTDDADRLYNLFGIVVHIGKYVCFGNPASQPVFFQLPINIIFTAARTTDTTSLLSKPWEHGSYSTTTTCILSQKAIFINTLATPTRAPHTSCTIKPLTSTSQASVSARPLLGMSQSQASPHRP